MLTVGAAGIPACGIAARNSASYGCLQCRGQECPQLLRFAFSRYFFSFDPPIVFFFVFSDYGRVLCTNKRLYIRLSRTGSRKT